MGVEGISANLTSSSTDASSDRVRNAIATTVLRQVMAQQKSQAEAILAMGDMPTPAGDGQGKNLDVYA
jgi:hypothetical protein